MRLSRPKVVTFWIAVVLAVLGVLASLGSIPGLSRIRSLAGGSRVRCTRSRQLDGKDL